MSEVDGLPGRLLTIRDLMELLGRSEASIRRDLAAKRIPFIKVGGLVRFRPDRISEWLDSLERGGD